MDSKPFERLCRCHIYKLQNLNKQLFAEVSVNVITGLMERYKGFQNLIYHQTYVCFHRLVLNCQSEGKLEEISEDFELVFV